MRNRITCSAQKLSQLEPEMVESVVGGHVYKLGHQYMMENRVRIIDAHEGQINSEVDGTYGVYSQTIRLKSGTLTTKCSCPASEQPFCRHCVAVLLKNFQSRVPEEVVVEPVPEPAKDIVKHAPTEESKAASSSVDFKFHEIGAFVDWIQGAMGAISKDQPLPNLPDLPPGAVRSWTEAIQDLRLQYQASEKERKEFQSELRDCKNHIATLTQDLEKSTGEAKDYKVKYAELRNELDQCQDLLEGHAVIVKERDRYVDQMNGLRGELLRKGAELDSLADTLKKVSSALQAATPPPR
jgi:SWIM zinc finger